MSDNEAMIVVIEFLQRQGTNPTYIAKLDVILSGLRGRKHIEEECAPQYQSILLFGKNIFPFSMKEYHGMANEILTQQL